MGVSVQERLRQLREEAGLSQEKLAPILDVTRMTLAGYELGKRAPDAEFIMKACEFFKCTPDYIFGVSSFKNNDSYQEWISSSETLSVGLSMLSEPKRVQLVAALNWLLQDNFSVNQIVDNDYLISKFIDYVVVFTDVFQNFRQAFADGTPISNESIYKFYHIIDKDKATLNKDMNTICSDLLNYLILSSMENQTSR